MEAAGQFFGSVVDAGKSALNGFKGAMEGRWEGLAMGVLATAVMIILLMLITHGLAGVARAFYGKGSWMGFNNFGMSGAWDEAFGSKRRSRYKGGNMTTASNSPLWEGGALSDQANLAVPAGYADASLVGATGWISGAACPPGRSGLAVGEATRGQALGSISADESGCSAGRLSDADLAKLAM